MKVLLDHCVDRRLARALAKHEVKTAAEMHWEALKNGTLISVAAADGFEVMLTVDKGLRFQQNLDLLPLTVIELDVPDSRLPVLLTVAPHIEAALTQAARFRFISLASDGRMEGLAARI